MSSETKGTKKRQNWGQDWDSRMAEAPRSNEMTDAAEKMEREEKPTESDKVTQGIREISAEMSAALAVETDEEEPQK
ncbi:MAG: hypothetical protein ACYDCF_08660 [Burkholderiales bacterium]